MLFVSVCVCKFKPLAGKIMIDKVVQVLERQVKEPAEF
jgi:hypothetical protein